MEPTRGRVRLGAVNHLQRAAESPLFRNGRVLTKRDGGDSGGVAINLEHHETRRVNARRPAPPDRPTLTANGVRLFPQPADPPDFHFLDPATVMRTCPPDSADTVRAVTGAATVSDFDHKVRSAASKSGRRHVAGDQAVPGPAHLVPGDHTLVSALGRLRDRVRSPAPL